MHEKLTQTNKKEQELKLEIKDLEKKAENIYELENIHIALTSGKINKTIIKKILKTGIINASTYANWIGYIEKLSTLFPIISKEIFSSPNIQKFVKTPFSKLLITEIWEHLYYSKNQNELKITIETHKKIWTKFSLSTKDISQIINSTIIQTIGNTKGSFYESTISTEMIKIILEYFPIDKKTINTAIKKGIILRLKSKQGKDEHDDQVYKDINKILNEFELPDKTLKDIKLQKALLNKIQESEIDRESLLMLLHYKTLLPKEIFLLPKTQKTLTHAILNSTLDESIKIIKKFNSVGINIEKNPEIIQNAQKLLILKIRNHEFKDIIKIKENFIFSKQFLLSEDYITEVKKYLIELLNENISYYTKQILKFYKVFNLSNIIAKDEQIKQKAKKFFMYTAKDNDLSLTKKFADTFKLSTEDTTPIIERQIINALQINNIQRVIDLKNTFSLPPQILKSILKNFISQEILEGNLEKIFKIKEELQIDNTFFLELDEEILKKVSNAPLIKFIKYLNNEDVTNLISKTIKQLRETIILNLSKNEDLADYFLENIINFYKQPWAKDGIEQAIQHYSVANKFLQNIQYGKGEWIIEPWIKNLIEKAQTIVDLHIEKHDDEYYEEELLGFKKEDPFKNHPLRQIHSNLKLGYIMTGKTTPAKSNLELPTKTIDTLREINNIIEKEHSEFLEKLKKSTFIPIEDKVALTNPEKSKVKMNNLLFNVRNFISRYLNQITDGDIKRLNDIIIHQKRDIKHLVKEGYKKYLKIYEIDIPLYDKLYEEFDNWREAGRYPMEVYLGRDGIYAYIGRQAQDSARKHKIGKEKRKRLKIQGEILEINPKYLVYPRYFRDNLNYETKREFLEQEQVSPDMDPLFYDTGYTGTIPEQIMRIMNFDEKEIEERIRLLSARTAKRRVKGISENARNEIIEYIEYNAKTEHTSVGLIKDETTGKIRHIAEPTSPQEQFYFMMIKQAIARHYLIQERLHFKAPENTNYDSENYYIRIRQEYADIMPNDFIKNPKQYLKLHKENNNNEKNLLSFKLKDDTEVIAKHIELKKTKDTKKEFMILIAAKKSGLPSAEPVGFLSGKKEKDGNYLLTEKVEGYSGKSFKKYLQTSKKFSTTQITKIIAKVTKRLRELTQLFQEQLNIDKHWDIKDTIIQFDEKSKEVISVIPVNWERVKIYKPK